MARKETEMLRLRFFHRIGLLVPLLRFYRWAQA
jgi:hypothetical protein